jgi:hypothetical protein
VFQKTSKKKKKNEGEKWSPPGEIFAVIFFSTMSSFQIALRSDTHVISLDKKKRAAKGKKNISTSNINTQQPVGKYNNNNNNRERKKKVVEGGGPFVVA